MKLFAFAVAVSAQERSNVIPSVEDALVFDIAGRTYKAQHGFAYNWEEAVQYCEEKGMQLIEFDEDGLYDAVWQQIGTEAVDPHGDTDIKAGRAYWVGYKEKVVNGQVKIRPQSLGTYINDDGSLGWEKAQWWDGEPNDNPNQGIERCVRMRRKEGETGTMNDAMCSYTWAGAKKDNRNMSFICQTPKDDPPTPPGYDESPLCPSEYFGEPEDGCYVQNTPWDAVTQPEITCAMENKACLNVSCSADGITAKFRADLFHSNLFDNGRGFIEQLNDDTRELYIGGVKVEKGGQCGFTTDGDFVVLDNWSYSACSQKFPDIKPSLSESDDCPGENKNAIDYTIRVTSPGNAAEDNQIIEFYVDTSIDATCSYCSNIFIQADGFWINQEDVEAAKQAGGNLTELFDCKLYADENRSDEIEDHNIVNMGQKIYGTVTSSANLPGIQYELVEFKVSDASGKTNDANGNPAEFLVIDNGVAESLVDAQVDGVTPTGSDLFFSYLSFGFEDLDQQNSVNNQCKIKLSLVN